MASMAEGSPPGNSSPSGGFTPMQPSSSQNRNNRKRAAQVMPVQIRAVSTMGQVGEAKKSGGGALGLTLFGGRLSALELGLLVGGVLLVLLNGVMLCICLWMVAHVGGVIKSP